MKMRSFIFGLAAVFICSPATAIVQNAQSQQPWLSNAEVYSIVRKFQSSYADTFDRRDAKGMAAPFSADALFQTEGGVIQGPGTTAAKLIRVIAAYFLPRPPRPSIQSPSSHLVECCASE